MGRQGNGHCKLDASLVDVAHLGCGQEVQPVLLDEQIVDAVNVLHTSKCGEAAVSRRGHSSSR